MEEKTNDSNNEKAQAELAVWARSDAFPAKPSQGAEFGFFDVKGKSHSASSIEELGKKIKNSRDGVDLVWVPEVPRLLVPESVEKLHSALRSRRFATAQRDMSDGLKMGGVFGVILIWTLFSIWQKGAGGIDAFFSNPLAGIAALLFFMFGFLPLYEGWKAKRELNVSDKKSKNEDVADAQFDVWMYQQKVPVTYVLLGMILLCGIVQFYVDRGGASLQGMKLSILRAGYLKQEGVQFLAQFPDAEAPWRILTGTMLHGNIVHLLMNLAGLRYLARRTEILTRWPHLLIVFLISVWVGGYASFYWYPDRPAVGVSGGIMGLLGFLLVFELLNKKLVPRLARKRLAAGVVLAGVIGGLGVSFIDNAAHAGGLLAGMIYAALVFPPSKSFHRPEALRKDLIVGSIAGVGILASALTAIIKMLG